MIPICLLRFFLIVSLSDTDIQGQNEKVNVSSHQCIKHYLNISSRRFAEDDTLSLIAFDIVSRKRAMAQTFPMCKLNPSEIAHCESVTASELAVLDHDANRAYAFQKGQLFQEKSGMRSANLILRKVEATLGSTFATT